MDRPTTETIRRAVTANRGGLAGLTDAQILTLWQSLDTALQAAYLESVEGKETTHAARTKTRGNVPNRTGQ